MPAAWPKEEAEYLERNWGSVSIPAIAKKFNRSVNAVKLKARRMGLGRHIHSGEYITLSQLLQALKVSYSTWTNGGWGKHGLPVKTKKSIKRCFRVIYLEDFWTWAEHHKMLVDFARVERNSLGPEPPWVADKRKADLAAKKYKKTSWSPEEDARLINLLNTFQYSYREISIKLGRKESAIKRRMIDLKLMQRPLKADNHNPWMPEEKEILMDMYYKGYISEIIAEKINRSALAINGKIERLVKEGQLDKTRYRKMEQQGYRPIDKLLVTPRTKMAVAKRPEKERLIIRRFGSDLYNTATKVGRSPDFEGISEFLSVWRHLNIEIGGGV